MFSAILNAVFSVKSPLGIATTVLLLESDLQLRKDYIFLLLYVFVFRSRATDKVTWSNLSP